MAQTTTTSTVPQPTPTTGPPVTTEPPPSKPYEYVFKGPDGKTCIRMTAKVNVKFDYENKTSGMVRCLCVCEKEKGGEGACYILSYGEKNFGKIRYRAPDEFNPCMPMAVSIKIAKFKLHQYQWRAICQSYPLCSICTLMCVYEWVCVWLVLLSFPFCSLSAIAIILLTLEQKWIIVVDVQLSLYWILTLLKMRVISTWWRSAL